MIIEIDTKLLDKIEDLTINQLVFLSLVLNDNQNTYQNIHKLLSLVSEQEILNLIERDLISSNIDDICIAYTPTKTLKSLLSKKVDYFDELYNAYPIYVVRTDGIKSFLRSNVNKCRQIYNQITGRSSVMHEHIMNCLAYELDQKTTTGKMGYMKTMYRWLTNHEWEAYEEQLKHKDEPIKQTSYGTDLI